MSDTFPPRSRRKGASVALLLLAAAAFLAGCLGATPYVPTRPEEDLLEAKGDKALSDAVRKGEKDSFALIVVFRKDVFLAQSTMLDSSSIPVLSEFGNAALLLVRPNEVLPLLRDPSLTKAAWFGPQGRLARLEPTLEFEMLERFGKGAERRDAAILVRFRSVPEAAEEKAVEAAGFKILTKAGPTFIVSGPMSGIPKLLGHDWIVYLEKGTPP